MKTLKPKFWPWAVFFLLAAQGAGRGDSGTLELFGSARFSQEPIRVERVISTDTILLENNVKVRLIGLKALPLPERPEIQRDQFGFVIKEEEKPFATIEERALQFVKNLLEGEEVRLEFDVQKKDKGLKTLAYVFTVKDGRLANEEILKMGYASLHILPPNMKYADRFRQAYREARQARRGIHGDL